MGLQSDISATTPLRVFLLLAITLTSPLLGEKIRIELVGTSIVEENTLTFAAGPAARWSQAVNGRTHQQSPLTTYRGYQYVTYFDSERQVCIGRRKLPDGPWQTIHFEDHHFSTNDSHNTAVLGICDKDGTIHMAFDHHASQLNYRISKIGAAHSPNSAKWDKSLFGEKQHTLGSVQAHDRVTYPRFFPAPNGNLMLYYRAVTSANGDGMIEEYDGEKHDWTPGLGKFIARDIGSYTANNETSLYRCPYMNSLSYAGERLHASWIWRDRFEKTEFHNQHDLCCAYSDDHGRTWHNSAGSRIGTTGSDPIHLNSSGLVVAPIPIRSGLSNQCTHYAYEDGSIHVVMFRNKEGTKRRRYHHYWRTAAGDWNSQALTFSGTRPKLVGAKDHSLIFTYSDDKELIQFALGTPNQKRTHWQWSELETPGRHSCHGESLLDLERWEKEKILSIYSQDEPTKTIRTKKANAIDGLPSPLKVIDYRLNLEGTN